MDKLVPSQTNSPVEAGAFKLDQDAPSHANASVDGEVFEPEQVEILKRLETIIYGELGDLNIEAVRSAAEELKNSGVRNIPMHEHTQVRFEEELKHYLCWRPKIEGPSVWIAYNPELRNKALVTPEQTKMLIEFERSVMKALSDSCARPQELEKIIDLVDLATELGVEINVSDPELRQLFKSALRKRKYIVNIIEFIKFSDKIGMELDQAAQTYAIEDAIEYTFNGVHGIGSEDIERAEELISFANGRGLSLDLNRNKILKDNILRGIALLLSGFSLEGAQVIFDFCQKYGISIDVKDRGGTTLGNSISEILKNMAHRHRTSLNLEGVEDVLFFCEYNEIDAGLPEDMIERWREVIPKLVARREARRGW